MGPRSLAFLAGAGIALAGCAGPSEPPLAVPGFDAARPVDLSFTDGAYVINTELEAGTYRTEGSADEFPSCNWKRFRGGAQGGLIASGSATGPMTILIEATDGAFESRGCRPWVRQP